MAVCIALIAIELAVLITALVMAVWRFRQAAQAIEIVAYRLEEKASGFGSSLGSRALQILSAFAGGWWHGKK